VAWQKSKSAKTKGGFGFRDLSAWNKAKIAKLTWIFAIKG